ncbi:MAG: SCO family protein [Chloroflexota bacterium]|nr:SCO family protein [Chloroflexota bacterium]
MATSLEDVWRAMAEESIGALVDAIRDAPSRRDELVALLPEAHPVYCGRSANAVVRLRGYILAAFEDVGLPAAAYPYVLDELQNSRDAYVTAGAAKALRGLVTPRSDVVPYLLRAIENIRYLDDALSFETYRPARPLQRRTTALAEIFKTLRWLGPLARAALADLESLAAVDGNLAPRARDALSGAIEAIRAAPPAARDGSCCHGGPPARTDGDTASTAPPGASPGPPLDVALQDQDGTALSYGEFFAESPSIVVFFYTRCDNPNKCSLSITKLARLQRTIVERGLGERIKTAAITYDPGFDVPQRLRAYGENRDVVFDQRNRFFRTSSDSSRLRSYFELGVNYGDVLVNRHRIELFVVDAGGHVVASFTRLQWDPDEVLDRAAALLDG